MMELEIAPSHISNKKRLGQFFSGSSIATLLAHLAQHQKAKSIIDPMSGSGDMIAACDPDNNPHKKYFGVEIDDAVSSGSSQRFDLNHNVQVINSNCFDLKLIETLASNKYDLVITNPPYVRYQTINNNSINLPKSLSTSEIKKNLIYSLNLFNHLDQKDKELFEILISKYSGLSDLAVPSWLLCAILTNVGGRLAMVVPQTWLNREYANVIQYLLLRWFQIEHIVEDANSVWFPDAQVKTTLLVAKRIERKNSISSWKSESFSYTSIHAKAKNENSLVGNVFQNHPCPEKVFVKCINNGHQHPDSIDLFRIKISDFAKDLIRRSEHKWFDQIEPQKLEKSNEINLKVPSKIKNWLGDNQLQFRTLSDYGVNIGQGLRTGSNAFFYMDVVETQKNGKIVKPLKPFKEKRIFIPSKFHREVIRKQSELNGSFTTSDFIPRGIVLCLQQGITRHDLAESKISKSILSKTYQTIPTDLDNHIIDVARTNIGTIDKPKFVTELSAVKPNIKRCDQNNSQCIPRFWYMLPEFMDRHSPDLFIPRVNGSHPITRLNHCREYLVDANFSSLWINDENSELGKEALLALLNSSWCLVLMEEYGTVMGGGALKLEATQIKKIPIPIFSKKMVNELSIFGKELIQEPKHSKEISRKVDCLVVAALGFNGNSSQKVDDLTLLKNQLLYNRSKKRDQ